MAPTRNSSPLIIAGCGYVGREVLRQCLAAADCPHHPLAGTAESTASLDKIAALGVRAVRLNLDEAANFDAPTEPWSLLYLVPPGRESPRDHRLERFLGAAGVRPPQRMVYVSTTGVYGDRAGATVSENEQVRPDTDRARRRVDAEEQVRAFAASRDIRWAILRAPGIYGPGRLALAALREGRPVLREEDCGPGNRIHRDDLASCCLLALVTDNNDRVFNICDDDHASQCAFTLELARQAGLPAPPQLTLAEARRQFSAARLSFVEASRQVDNARMHRELGALLRYPDFVSGIAASLREEAEGD